MHLFSLILTSFVLSRVLGTFSPSGSVSIDCGGQQTFTCTVTGQASWTITGLMGVTTTFSPGITVAAASARVTTTDTGVGSTSTINITGFSTSDNGGTVQCLEISGMQAAEGMATIAVVSTTLASATAVMATVDQCSATLTWSEPSDSNATTSVSCTPSSPQCSSCTSSACTIGGLPPSTSYTFSVTRSRSGCDDSTAVSSAVMSGGIPSCPTNVLVTDRSSDFSSATITWDQPTNSPPVTSYNVTCNSSCTDMPCSSGSSTCRVLSVSPCEDHSVTVLPMNRCGSRICTRNSVPVPAQVVPDCGKLGVTIGNDTCPSFLFTPENIIPSSVRVSYSNSSGIIIGSINCSYNINSRICRAPVSPGRYTVTVIPQNSCGSPSACQQSSRIEEIPADCDIVITSAPPPPTTPTTGPTSSLPPAALGGIIAAGIIVTIVSVTVGYPLVLLILACTCYSSIGFCGLLKCRCFNGKARRSSSKQRIDSASPVTPPAQPPAQAPADEYADPQAIRDRKERGKEDKDKIQYAAIDFSAGAGSGAGEVKIHQKEEPVIYTTVQHV